MAAKTLYFKNAVVNGAMSLQDGGSPPSGITTTGWLVAKLTAGNFALMAANVERASTLFAPTDALASPALTAASCWRSETTFNGGFANTDWTLNFRVRAASAAAGQTGRVNCRIWRSPNVDGSGAVQLTTVPLVGSTTPVITQSTPVSSIVVWHPGAVFTFKNEYLFVQCEWEVVAPSSNANADVLFYVDSTTNITTPDYAIFLFPQWHDDIADAFWAPSPIILINGVSPALYDNEDSLFTPGIITRVDTNPALHVDLDTFEIAAGASEYVGAALCVDDPDIFAGSAIKSGDCALGADLYETFEVFFAPGIVIGQPILNPSCVSDMDKFLAAKIVGGVQKPKKKRLSGSISNPSYMFGSTGTNMGTVR